jgi:hypothetical protein
MSYMKRALEEQIQVRVYLNQNERESFMDGFKSTDPLICATSYFVTADRIDGGSVNGILNEAFAELNRDEPTANWARVYRARGRRSLSVGDVVVIGEIAYAVERVGWKAVSISTENVRDKFTTEGAQ